MGYKEEIFERLELTNFRTSGEIADWLAGPKKFGNKKSKSSSYRNFAIQLQEPFAVRDAIEKTNDFDELRRLKKEAQSLEIRDRKTLDLVETKMKSLSEELSAISEERKEKRLQLERLESDKETQQDNLEKYNNILIELQENDGDKRKIKNARRNIDKIKERLQTIEEKISELS